MVVTSALAQQPYPSTTAPRPAWGGQALPAQVPFQPTLISDSNSSAGQSAVTYGLPAGGTPAAVVGQPPQGAAYTLQGPVALPPEPGSAANAAQPWQPYAEGNTQLGEPVLVPQEPLFPETPPSGLRPLPRPADARDGVFQKAKFTGTWIPQLDDDSLGWTDVRSEIVFGLPFFTRDTPILITPSYELHFLDRPNGSDLPPRLHDLVIDFNHFRRVTDNWIANIAVAPGLYTDDHSFDSDDALRINGRAVAVYDPTPEWKGLLGVAYLHGGWDKIVPIAGVVYEPNDDVKYELVYPRPRVAWRLPISPVPGRDEFWFYVLGEFQNAIWAFEQDDGSPNTFASRDWRLILGLERKIIGGLSHRVEIGYVFNREIKLASDGTDVDLDDSVLLRAGIVY
jgi:hypothetical protein